MVRGSAWWRPGPGRFHVPWLTTLRDRNDLSLLSADDLTAEMLTQLSVIAVPVVAEKSVTFPRTNVFTEVLCERSNEPVCFSARPDDHAGVGPLRSLWRTSRARPSQCRIRSGPEQYHSGADPHQRSEAAAMTSGTSPFRDGDAANTPRISGAATPEASGPPKSPSAGAPPKPPGPDNPPKGPGPATPSPNALMTTRAAAAWFATAVALVLLVLLIILILQNQDVVELHYLGFTGSLPLGTALFIAAVAGAAVVAIVGVVRLTQLRVTARRARRLDSERDKKP